jgi:hypothetical protein
VTEADESLSVVVDPADVDGFVGAVPSGLVSAG